MRKVLAFAALAFAGLHSSTLAADPWYGTWTGTVATSGTWSTVQTVTLSGTTATITANNSNFFSWTVGTYSWNGSVYHLPSPNTSVQINVTSWYVGAGATRYYITAGNFSQTPPPPPPPPDTDNADTATAEDMLRTAGGGEVEVWGKNEEGEWELLTTMLVDENGEGTGVWDDAWNDMELRYDLTGVLLEGEISELGTPVTIAQGGGLTKTDGSSFTSYELGRNVVSSPTPGGTPSATPSFSPPAVSLPTPIPSVVGAGTYPITVSGTTPSASTTESMSAQTVAEGVKAALDSYTVGEAPDFTIDSTDPPADVSESLAGGDQLGDLADAEDRFARATSGFIAALQAIPASLVLTFPSSEGVSDISWSFDALGQTYTIRPPAYFWDVTRALARLVYTAMAVGGAYSVVRYFIS